MASGDPHYYTSLFLDRARKTYNLESDAFRVMLVTGYSFNEAHTNILSVRPYEVSGSGYTAGGILLANKLLLTGIGGKPLYWAADNPIWASISVGTPSHMILYFDGGSDTTRRLMGAWELGVASTGGAYNVPWELIMGSYHVIMEMAEIP